MTQLAIIIALFWYVPIDPATLAEGKPVAAVLKPSVCRFLPIEKAERILSAPVTIVDSSMKDEDIGRSWRCLFAAKAAEGETKKQPMLHFMFTKSPTVELAASVFDAIKRSNEEKPGFEVLRGVGDEALAQTDGKGFHLVIVRKGARTIRLKANPIGNATLESVKAVAAELALKLDTGDTEW